MRVDQWGVIGKNVGRPSEQATRALAKFRENFCVEIGPDPKPGNLYQFINHRLAQIDQASAFRSDHDAEETRGRQARGCGSPTGTPFIHKEEVGSMLYCKQNCLSLAGVQILPKFLHAPLVVYRCNYQPGLRLKIDCRRQIPLGCGQFLKYGRGNRVRDDDQDRSGCG
jgi:hypothetical protein